MRQKFKIALELLLNHLSEKSTRNISIFFSNVKKILAKYFIQNNGASVYLIKLCDFIIVRTNGNKFIEFELTNICNAQCVFCPYPDMLRTEKKFMNMDESTLEKSIQKISIFRKVLISFTPTTGDTLLHPEWDKYIGKVLQENNVKQATLFTNAIKLNIENQHKFIALLKKDYAHKMSQIYFSVGGLDHQTYIDLYKVDRFQLVVDQINEFILNLIKEKIALGIHIHLKFIRENSFDRAKAFALLNKHNYPFVYISHSYLFYSNDGYRRNALIKYYPDTPEEKNIACSYLYKTRFAADGSIWADGCVISEMPGDSSLKLGSINDSLAIIENNREAIIQNWELNKVIPKPCQGCTVYHCKK